MKCLVTGHNGFIGKILLEHLTEDEVITLEKDFLNQSDWETKLIEYVESVDVIFHIGAISDTTLQDYNEMLKYNYYFSTKLFDYAQLKGKKVIYSSSAAIYGTSGLPTNIYGWSKLMAEDYGMQACDKFVSLRYFNVFGPGEEHKGKMASVVYQAYKQGDFKLFPGKPKRDFIYVYDVVTANLMAVNASKGIYEVGSGETNAFETMLDVFNIPYSYHSKDRIPSWYQYNTKADSSKWVPGWKPNFSLKQGLKNYKEYLKK